MFVEHFHGNMSLIINGTQIFLNTVMKNQLKFDIRTPMMYYSKNYYTLDYFILSVVGTFLDIDNEKYDTRYYTCTKYMYDK